MKTSLPVVRTLIVLAGLIGALSVSPARIAAEESHAGQAATTHEEHQATSPNEAKWLQQLNEQIAREEAAARGQAVTPGQAVTASSGAHLHKQLADQLDAAVKARPTPVPAGGFANSAQAHAAMQGPLLVPAGEAESVVPGSRCPASAPVRAFDITAIEIEISLNRFLDYYPGYMYVLTENLDKAREEEKRNKEARPRENDPGAVSVGLQGDIIQPLVIRGNQGDCVVITLRNQVEGEPVNLHIHGSSMIVQATGKAATATNRDTTVLSGKSQVFEWYIRPDEQEGGHMFHSHVSRKQTGLGMVGTFNVELRGSRHLDPFTGKEMKSGWEAMIEDPNGPDFREFTVIYHEVGDEAFRPLDRDEKELLQRDPVTDTYRPGGRALNYRSEPHGTRLALQKKVFGVHDESHAYGSYMFADPATTVPRSYLGDPAKWRLVHGGSEVIHSHHLHGGADRWPRQPEASEKNFAMAAEGPIKYPSIRVTSDRLDVQALAPTEVFDQVIECGSGGCQQQAGDFLYHCHIPQHYVTGMWAFWRVYNSLQTGDYPTTRTDVMPALQELPDRKGRMKPAVDSSKLIGTTVDWFGGKKFTVTADKTDWSANPQMVAIKDWVEMVLPPQGKPGKKDDEKGQVMAYDATVLDWTWEGAKAMNERETTSVWVNYKSPLPGKRTPFLFDPVRGRLAYPHLKPHLGKRPPFGPNHGGAPFLEPIHLRKDGTRSTEPARPGEQGPWSLCPERAGRKFFTVHGIQLPITLKKATKNTPAVVDPLGQIFVLHEEKAQVKANPDFQRPLIIRANVYDCVDVIYKSEVADREDNVYSSKTNMHIHFVQFDTQASDGVISGMSYEQSVRPFTMLEEQKHEHGLPSGANALITADTAAGSTSLQVSDASRYHLGIELGIGMDEVNTFEVRRIKEIKNNEIVFDEPLVFAHKKKEIVSVEFVRSRWYADVDFGITYWHDHVFGTTNWTHGFFGGIVIEPAGSTYHDPVTGKEIRSGPIADIHTIEPVSAHVKGSFREMVMRIMDSVTATANLITADNAKGAIEGKGGGKTVASIPSASYPSQMMTTPVSDLNGGDATTGSAFEGRAEPLAVRLANNPDPSQLFNSQIHGDPGTPLLRAYLGDPIVVRALVAAGNEAHTWHVTGHWFPMERFAEKARPRNTIHIAIAERYDLAIPAAGGPQRMPGDYPYYNGRTSKLSEGSWGIIRVLDKRTSDLKPLPGREVIPQPAASVCPAEAPVKEFAVAAIDKAIQFHPGIPKPMEVDGGRYLRLGNEKGKLYVLEGDKGRVASGTLKPHPLTLHVNVGDCLKITLKNEMAKAVAGLHADMLAYDPNDSMGVTVGRNQGDQTVPPGKSKTYTFYAHPEYGENAALIQDWGNILENSRDGLFGAVIIGPKGSRYRDPVTGEDISLKNSWRADVIVDRTISGNELRANYRDLSLYFQDEDNVIGASFMPYLQKVAGLTGVNYRAEPLSYREDQGCSEVDMFACAAVGSDPNTPTIEAHAGDAVTLHVFGAVSEQVGVFALEGHEWPLEPGMAGSDLLSGFEFGGSEVINAILHGGAGGPFHLTGDYIWQNHRESYAEAGQWGVLRVLPVEDTRILPLMGQAPAGRTAEGPSQVVKIPQNE